MLIAECCSQNQTLFLRLEKYKRKLAKYLTFWEINTPTRQTEVTKSMSYLINQKVKQSSRSKLYNISHTNMDQTSALQKLILAVMPHKTLHDTSSSKSINEIHMVYFFYCDIYQVVYTCRKIYLSREICHNMVEQ